MKTVTEKELEMTSEDIEETGEITQQEQQVMHMIQLGRWNRYRQSVFKLDGQIDMGASMARYAKIVNQWKEFRTVYRDQNAEMVRVVLREKDRAFPVHDVSFLSEKQQTFLIKNVMAALARHEFDPETDRILQLHGFLLNDHEIMIVAADYPHLPMSYGVRNLICEIFKGMHMNNADAPVIHAYDVQQMNERFVEKNLQYWKNLLLPLGKSLMVPGEKIFIGKSDRSTCFYGELEKEAVCNMSAYCQHAGIEMETLFLSAWGNILGNYNEEAHPVLAVSANGEKMRLFPVKVDRTKDKISCLKEVDVQLKQMQKNSGCSEKELEEALDTSFFEYFHVVQEFMKFSEVDVLRDGNAKEEPSFDTSSSGDDGISIKIMYQMFGDTIGIVYRSKNGVFEQVLQQLHKLFTSELSHIMQEKEPQANALLQVDDSQSEEKYYELYRKQIVDALDGVELFDCISREALPKFAEVCHLQTYLANDVIVEKGKECSGFYVVAEGNVEESIIAMDGMVKSVRMLNKGQWFGVECLLRGKTSASTYTVAGKEAKLVFIDQKFSKELFRVRPECWVKVLEEENRQKKIYQKLWTMD